MGGGSGKAQRAAERQEAERQAAIRAGTGRINAIFDAPERQAQYADFVNAVRENYMRDANRQKALADRRLKFSLARSGLTGGSAAVDANRTLGEEYTQGILGAESRAQAAGGDLRGQDEATRLQLQSMVQAGLDATTAASRAMSGIQANAQSAKGAAFAQGLGDIFGSTADIYRRQEEAAARRRGARDAQVSIYGPRPFSG